MRALRKVISARHNELRGHRLFVLLSASRSSEPLARLARSLSFWPMAFQDLLRLNAQKLRGTGLEHLANYECEENVGHDNWYLHDLHMFEQNPPSFEELFGSDFQDLRDICYALLSEVHRPQSPAQRVALMLALEPTGRAFFEQVSRAVDRVCPELPLRYFARSHLAHDREYDLFVESMQAELDRLSLSDEERHETEAMVARVYQLFSGLFDYLADRAYDGVRAVSDVRELGAPRAVAQVAHVERRARGT